MTDTERFERWFAPAVSRRTVLRGGLLGGVGLAAAALIGCGGDDDDDDGGSDASTGSSSTTGTTSSGSTSSGGASGGSTTTSTTGGDEPGEGMLVRDPDLPFPYHVVPSCAHRRLRAGRSRPGQVTPKVYQPWVRGRAVLRLGRPDRGRLARQVAGAPRYA